jgi:hypothetical protein
LTDELSPELSFLNRVPRNRTVHEQARRHGYAAGDMAKDGKQHLPCCECTDHQRSGMVLPWHMEASFSPFLLVHHAV